MLNGPPRRTGLAAGTINWAQRPRSERIGTSVQDPARERMESQSLEDKSVMSNGQLQETKSRVRDQANFALYGTKTVRRDQAQTLGSNVAGVPT